MLKPDPSFVRELKKISPNLSVEWTLGLERWVIWYKPDNGPRTRVHEVKNPDGSFRPLDGRVLEMLRRCDMSTKTQDPDYLLSEHFRKVKAYKEEVRRKSREERQRVAREMSNRWSLAAENATRGIYNEKQLGRRTLFSFAPIKSTQRLLQKLGAPALTGAPVILKP